VAVHGLGEADDETWTWHRRKDTAKGKEKGLKEVQHPTPGLPSDKSPSTPHNEVNWLKDPHMLPQVYPKARIMTFGYPTTLPSPKMPPADILLQIAKELLRELEEARGSLSRASRRPIIFIGHRFGGLVIEQAVVLASEVICNDTLKSSCDVTSKPTHGNSSEPTYNNISKPTHVKVSNSKNVDSSESKHDDILKSTVGIIFLSTPFRGYRSVTLPLARLVKANLLPKSTFHDRSQS